MTDILTAVDVFLAVKHHAGGYHREAFLPVMDWLDYNGRRAPYAPRLDPARDHYWRVVAAMLLIPEELVCSARAGGKLAPLSMRAAAHHEQVALVDLPVEVRSRIARFCGVKV